MIRILRRYGNWFAKWLLKYFPIVLVVFQLIGCAIQKWMPDIYAEQWFYIGGVASFTWFMSLVICVYAFYFRFCFVSRACAAAQVIFSVADIVVKGKEDYNNLIQLLVGGVALGITIYLFTVKPEKKWVLEK